VEWHLVAEVPTLPKAFILKQLAGRSRILVQALLLTVVLIVDRSQSALSQGREGVVNELKVKARRAEDSGNIKEADRLYVEAVEEAKKSCSKTDVVEMISRLVRERAYNQKFRSSGCLRSKCPGHR
jgi:hypothetical protein